MTEPQQDLAYRIAPGHPVTCQCAGTGRWLTTKESATGGEVVAAYGACPVVYDPKGGIDMRPLTPPIGA